MKGNPSTSVFYRDPGHEYPVAVRGKGVYIYDANGKEYLDGSGGAAITCLGYCHNEVSKAIADQSDEAYGSRSAGAGSGQRD